MILAVEHLPKCMLSTIQTSRLEVPFGFGGGGLTDSIQSWCSGHQPSSYCTSLYTLASRYTVERRGSRPTFGEHVLFVCDATCDHSEVEEEVPPGSTTGALPMLVTLNHPATVLVVWRNAHGILLRNISTMYIFSFHRNPCVSGETVFSLLFILISRLTFRFERQW